MSSISAIHPFKGTSVYAATKAALEVLACSLNAEYSSKGVQVKFFRLPPFRSSLLSQVAQSATQTISVGEKAWAIGDASALAEEIVNYIFLPFNESSQVCVDLSRPLI
jgi:short-subunit dehydrogenase